MEKNTRALLLVGHGSSLTRDASAPVYEHAARIRKRRHFDEVHVAFWKEPPWICDALGLIACDDVYVVPMFLAEGYFTRRVVPRELGPTRPAHLCPALGAHPCMARLVAKRAASVPVPRRQTALVVVGHGTERIATSSDTVRRVTRELRERSGFARVACGFLDEQPRIESVVNDIDAAHVVLVPFFMGEGYHTRTTIPGVLGLEGARTTRGGRVLWYTKPVGTLPEVAMAAVTLTHRMGGWAGRMSARAARDN